MFSDYCSIGENFIFHAHYIIKKSHLPKKLRDLPRGTYRYGLHKPASDNFDPSTENNLLQLILKNLPLATDPVTSPPVDSGEKSFKKKCNAWVLTTDGGNKIGISGSYVKLLKLGTPHVPTNEDKFPIFVIKNGEIQAVVMPCRL